MGWKGTLRSVQAASRRAEREARRRQRELERQQRQIEKMQALERAQHEVASFENHIDVITSVHADCGERWNWQRIASAPEPTEPQRLSKHEDMAQASLEAYEPALMDKVLRRVEAKQQELREEVEKCIKRDDLDHARRLSDYRQERHEWEQNRKIAEGILVGSPDAYIEAIRQVAPFAEIGELGSSVTIDVHDESFVEARIRIHGDDVIPRQRKSLLKSGKLSVKDMPKTHFWAYYQDYVCGAVLRVARELFALLPIDKVIVTALGDILNSQTGQIEEQPILSAFIPRETVQRLNFDLLDPSDSMENFVHNMKFYKTKGFVAVEALTVADIEPTKQAERVKDQGPEQKGLFD